MAFFLKLLLVILVVFVLPANAALFHGESMEDRSDLTIEPITTMDNIDHNDTGKKALSADDDVVKVLTSDETDPIIAQKKANRVGMSNLYRERSYVDELAELPIFGTLFFDEAEAHLVGGDSLLDKNLEDELVNISHKLYEVNVQSVAIAGFLLVAFPIAIGFVVRYYRTIQRHKMSELKKGPRRRVRRRRYSRSQQRARERASRSS